MGAFFSKGWDGSPFILFEAAHLVILLIIVVVNIWLLRFKGASEPTRKAVRWTMAIILWVNEAAWHVWNLYLGTWNIQSMLPLHMCSILIWLSGFMLIFRNYTIYEFVYFLGIGAGLQALLTPDVGIYNFPHFRFLQAFIGHGMMLTSGVYMTTVEGFRPTWKSVLKVIVISNIYMVIIFFFNSAIGSNYLMVNGKPPVASIIDLMPPWPYYLIYVEIIGIVTCLLLYVPFIIKDWRAGRVAAAID
jgi:hypothetical integral membrane protein (TIGR02206 family)